MPPPQPDDKVTFKSSFNLVATLAHIHACCIYPLIRTGFGWDYPGVKGALSMILILAWAGETRSQGLMNYFVVWVFAIVANRIWTYAACRYEHSFYQGFPYLAHYIVGTTESDAKAVEPLLCLIVGGLLHVISPTLGQFIRAGFWSLGIIELSNRYLRWRRDVAIHNAAVEMAAMTQRQVRR
jgi:hypothetical protein